MPVRRGGAPTLDPQLARVLGKLRHPLPELPGNSQELEGWFPDPAQEFVAHADPSPTPTATPGSADENASDETGETTPVPDPTASPPPRRYPVTEANLRAREEQKKQEQAQQQQDLSPQNSESPDEAPPHPQNPDPHDKDPNGNKEQNNACPDEEETPPQSNQAAFLQVDPQSAPPPLEWSRQTHGFSRYYPLLEGNTAYLSDEWIHLARDYDNLAPSEEIRWDWLSPVPEENTTSRATAASVVWKLQSLGDSPSSLNAHYKLECKVYDRRSPGGRVVFRRSEPMHLCGIRLHAALAARTPGDWHLTSTRGQTVAQDTVKVIAAPTPEDGWSRYRLGAFKAAADGIFYVNDEFAAKKHTYDIPAPDAQGQQSFTVIWDWLAPGTAHLNRTQRHSYATLQTQYRSDGTTYSLESRIWDPAYPKGRILSTQTGSGRLEHLEVSHHKGLPTYGSWQLRETLQAGDTATTATENLSVRQIKTSVTSDTPSLPIGGHRHDEEEGEHGMIAIPFHLKVETFPSNWTPEKLNWKLNIKGSNGQLRVYQGTLEEPEQSRHSFVQMWNGGDDQGQKFELGVAIDPVLVVSIPEETPAARSTLKVALASHQPQECSYLPPYVRVSFCTASSSCSPQIAHNNGTVTYSITHVRTVFPSIPAVGSLCFPVRFQCPGSIECRVNGFLAAFAGNGQWFIPPEVSADYLNLGDLTSTTYTQQAVFKLGSDMPHQCWPEGSTVTTGSGPLAGAVGVGWWDLYPINLAGDDEPPPPPPQNDVEAGDDDPENAKKDKKKTENSCNCNCPPNTVSHASPLVLDLIPGSGLYDRSEVDLAVPTRGLPLVLSRAQHSRQGVEEQPNGWTWTFRDSLVVDSAANLIYHRSPDGSSQAFSVEQNQILPTQQDITDTLTQIDARHYERVTKNHLRFVYEIPSQQARTEPEPVVAVLKSMTDSSGNTHTLSWDERGQKLYKMEGPVPGQFIRLDWNPGHNGPLLKSAVDHTGRRVHYTYRSYSNPLSPSGYDDLLTHVRQPGDKCYAYTYHSVLGKRRYVLLTSHINGLVQEKAVECDTNPFVLLEATHRLGATLKYQRTPAVEGKATAHITYTAPQGMPENQDQVWSYKLEDDMVTEAQDPVGNTVKYGYDSNHNLARIETARGLVTTRVFDDRRNLKSSTDNLNRTIRLDYDERDNLRRITDPDNGETVLTWNDRNELTAITDPAQHVQTLTRNRFGQITSITDALNHVTVTIGYDQAGFPHTVQRPAPAPGGLPAMTTRFNDLLGRPVKVQDPLGRVSRMTWDERNHLLEATLPAIQASGAQEALPVARLRQVFDLNDLLIKRIAADGLATIYSYDSAHRLRSVLPPGTQNPTRLDYDAMENVVRLTNGNSHTTTYSMDRLNRTAAMTYPGGDGETYHFDADSNLVAWNRGSYKVGYTYDNLNRLQTIDSPTTQDHITLTYDNLDRVDTLTDASGVTTYRYTPNYLLQQVLHSTGTGNLTYGYDDADRLTTLQAGSDITTYSYDHRDRLIQATLDGQSVAYAYDNADRPTLTSFSNGVTCQQAFNERDGLLSKRYLRGGSPLFSLKNAYNQLGQRIFEEKKTANWSKRTRYAYNKRREFSHSYRKVNNDCTVETSYSYDQNHNRIKKNETTYKNNANDQLTSLRRPNQTLNYNSAGQAQQAGSSAFTYAYNDQIKSVRNGPNSATYLYDGNGQRVQKTVDGVVSKFLWAGSEIIKEYTASGQVKAQYLLGAERTAIKTNGRWNFYVTDGLGSTVMLTDYRGRSVATWDYDDFGETTQLSGSPSVYNPFLYTGQELDKETGFYHLRARHYAPSLGKFLSRDPIGYAGGSNLYAYTSDPINYADPSGLIPDPFVAGLQEEFQVRGFSLTMARWQAEWIASNYAHLPKSQTGLEGAVSGVQGAALIDTLMQSNTPTLALAAWDNLATNSPLATKTYTKSTFTNAFESSMYHYYRHGEPNGLSFEEFITESDKWARWVQKEFKGLLDCGKARRRKLKDGTTGYDISSPSEFFTGGIVKVLSGGGIRVVSAWVH